MDMQSYFDRLGIAAPEPDASGLRALQGAHMRAIAFENIDPLLGSLPDVRPDAVFEKIVARGRGGYCFELNTLFGLALADCGFEARRVLARVRNGAANGGPRSHLAFVVTVDGELWLADTGFGGPGASAPLRLSETSLQEAPSGRYRVRRDEDAGEIVLERQTVEGWFSLFGFDDARVTDADIASSNFVCARSETAPFPSNLMVSRHFDDGRISLLNTALRSERAGVVKKREIASGTDLHDVLTGEFAISLDRPETVAIWDRLGDLGLLDGQNRRLAG